MFSFQIVHIREMPHSCNLCDKKFALAESLKKHMRAVHQKSRGFACIYCDYAASRADMLKIHVRKIHTKEWSYICEHCEDNGEQGSGAGAVRYLGTFLTQLGAGAVSLLRLRPQLKNSFF